MKMNFNIFEDLTDDMNDTSTRYNPEDDTVNKFNLMDTRKNKLMLKDINKLKKMRNVRKIENLNRRKIMGVMYIPVSND